MRDNPDELVTIAVLGNSPVANLVKNRLEAAGIRAYLEGEETVAMASYMAGLTGGVKVQVAACDAEDALAVLEEKASAVPLEVDPSAFATRAALGRLRADEAAENDDEVKEAIATPWTLRTIREAKEHDEDEEGFLSDREKAANRALTTAVLGLIFWPLQVYTVYLLIEAWISPERLEGQPRSNAKLATVLIALLVAFLALGLAALIRGPAER